MLVSFAVENFLSIDKRVELDLSAGPSKNELSCNVIQAKHHEVLKSGVLFGPNASGKSSLFSALNAFQSLAVNSFSQLKKGDRLPHALPFLLNETSSGQPTTFEMVFYLDDVLYEYGVSLTSKEIVKEWLTQKVERRTPLFVRENQKIDVKSAFTEGEVIPKDAVRENALFLAVVAQFNGELSNKILSWFTSILMSQGSVQKEDHYLTSKLLMQSPSACTLALELMQAAGIDVAGIQFDEESVNRIKTEVLASIGEQVPKEAIEYLEKEIFADEGVQFQHKKFSSSGKEIGTEAFPFESESDGTKKLYSLIGQILFVTQQGGVFVVDELDSSLHPLLLEFVVELFHSQKINKKNAQLIFTTHDPTTLTSKLFRRDQIWFVEKNQYGATEVFSLHDVQGVKKDSAYGRAYLLGKFGAVPSPSIEKLEFFLSEQDG